MGKINNVSTIKDEKAELARLCMEHRAIWMGLIYDEMLKAGVPNAEDIVRKAISRCGSEFHGKNIKDSEPKNLKGFSEKFNSELDLKIFEMDVDVDDDNFNMDFHYCPLVAGWQKLGFDDERIALLCEMAMEGDCGIASANGYKLDLNSTIAKGAPTCRIGIHR